ncbi:SBDS-like protein [Trypanosoma grayi]|uniref:SBDS-like protein n=1 Tax=Trypanosoma grayi TaxID=71804 RepID=UPI0004F3F6E2|nr:SBDS-like protein [Trypanosoma grayi]KEG13139.1 SBDS-like protein [Trypanosoma grayi]
MSARMQMPLSQRRHTNIAVVRYTKNGVKLEIACYKNKVISYRSGVETRLDEVLQVERVFTNVSRGLYASEKEIQTVFDKRTSEVEALRFILDHGELQVAQHERTAEIDQMFIDIALMISQKCVNEVTQRPFPPPVIEQALRSIGAAVKLDQPVKKQALALIHQLIDAQIIPISRARMKLRCIAPDEPSLVKLVEWCESNGASILNRAVDAGETEASTQKHSLLILLPPHLFRDVENFVKKDLPPGGTVHMVDSAAVDVGGGDVMDAELIARANALVSGGVGAANNGGPSQCTGSSDPRRDDSERSGNKGKRGGKKRACPQGASRKDDCDEQRTSVTADLSSTHAVEEEEEENGGELKAALSKLGLDETCASDGDDADGKGKRGKKKPKRRHAGGGGQQQPTTAKKEAKSEVPEDSDDEVLVNRKQRKHAAAKANGGDKHRDWDDEDEYNYDYAEEWEEEEGGERERNAAGTH